MQYTNNLTNVTVNAYIIGEVTQGVDNYAVSLPEIGSTIGLYPEQTASYVPVINDYYIDNGDIESSQIMSQSMFGLNYTEVT